MTIKEDILQKAGILIEDSTADFRSAILDAAENKELTTPGHILNFLSKKGKVPSTYSEVSKAMKFVISTISSHGGHYTSTNPKLMSYIDNMY